MIFDFFFYFYRPFAPTTNKGQKIDGTLSDKLLVFIIKNAYNDILNIFLKKGVLL